MAIPSGNIYLLKNVPLTIGQEHSIDFENVEEQFNYFQGFRKYTQSEYTYIRREREYIAVGLPLKDLDEINYLIFKSADGERWYYAFVTEKVFSNPNLTNVFFKIDVLQTYQFDYKWKETFIEQAHVDRWTAEHKPIYSKTDEGLDYGTEYSIESAYRIEQSRNTRWVLISTVDIPTGEGLTLEGFIPLNGNFKPVESPFACFLVPIITNPSYTSVSIGDRKISTYGDIVKFLLKSALGNYIRSISLLTYNPFISSETTLGQGLWYGMAGAFQVDFTVIKKDDGESITLLCLKDVSAPAFSGVLARADWDTGLLDSLPNNAQWEEVKKKPYTTKRDKRFESKLLCAPYRYNLLTDWRNNPVIFKNEYMTNNKIEVKYSCALSYNAPFRFYIEDYKKDPEGRYTCLSQPVAPEFPILSDAYFTYMLENKNTIQANLTNSIINAGTGVISGAISGAGVGGVGGAVYGALTGAVGGALNVQSQIRSENAKQADIQMKPDSIINSTDSAFNIIDNNAVLTFYRMRICCENEEIISQIFNITGYKVNRVEIPNTRSRTRFNYLKTGGANIVGSFNQDHLRQIKEIFDRGVTIWHYHEKDFNFLDYSYENIEVNLV